MDKCGLFKGSIVLNYNNSNAYNVEIAVAYNLGVYILNKLLIERSKIIMSKRDDNIRKRKDGRWEGRYKKGRSNDGKIQYASVYGKSYREVKEKITAIINEPIKTSIPKSKEKTFGEVLNLWMANNRIRLKGGTINKYQNLIDTHIMPELGLIPITALDSTRINSFLEKKLTNGKLEGSGGLSPSYVRSIMLVINATLKFAVNEQYCLPLKTPVYKPTIPKAELTILSLEEQQNLERALNREFDYTCAGILISLYTGMRIGEVCALSWEDVDLKNRVIHVRHTVARIKADASIPNNTTILVLDTPKTNASTRDIPISTILLPVLIRLRALSSSGFLLSGNNSFLKPRTLEHRYHKVLDEFEIPSVNFHALRHTFATRCIEAGVDVKSLSEILGHANVSVTLNTYVHSSMEMKRNQLEKLTTLYV